MVRCYAVLLSDALSYQILLSLYILVADLFRLRPIL